VSFAAITLCVASQRVFVVVVVVYFVIDSVRKLLDTLSYVLTNINSKQIHFPHVSKFSLGTLRAEFNPHKQCL